VARAAGRSPERIMSEILSAAPPGPLVVGLGNFVGLGEALSLYWARQGTEHGA
jgi:hypothetical protein